MSNGALIVLMSLLFLGLGYLGVPVAFALIAGVLVATAFTPVSFPSMIGQLFHGIDSETLLAVPFFLLVGELMTSAEVTHRMIRLSQTLLLRPEHIRKLPSDFVYTGMLYAIPLAAVAGVSAFGWMLAYLRGPDVVAGYITPWAGGSPAKIMFLLVVLFVILGDFVDAVPAIIIFMPVIKKLTELGGINPVHMGVVIITTLVFGLITPPYGLSPWWPPSSSGSPSGAMLRSLPLYVVFFVAIAFTVLFPKIVLWLPKTLLPQSVGCFQNPSGTGYICP